MTNDLIFDSDLWFEHNGCEGKHYLLGNPHTFPGRMWAWCPKKETAFCVSKSEIGEMSIQAKFWIKGFLIGNQPKPPLNKNNEVDYESQEYKDWKIKVDEFEETGLWQ